MTQNDLPADAKLAICIPAFRDDASALIRQLGALPEAADCALLLYDDGSGDPSLVARHTAALEHYPGPSLMHVALQNRGRSFARNWLVSQSPVNWILLIDADMVPDNLDFLKRYIDAIGKAAQPSLIAGGFSLDKVAHDPDTRLHYAQARASDCVDAETRSTDPGRFVFSSNILVHVDVLNDVRFDEGFTGWGWEDVDWGLRVAAAYPVIHIQNTATHLGLETDARLLNKFGTSGANFARLVKRHPGAAERMPLLKAARRVKGIPLVAPFARSLAQSRFLPIGWRVMALKLYRAAAYAPFIEPA